MPQQDDSPNRPVQHTGTVTTGNTPVHGSRDGATALPHPAIPGWVGDLIAAALIVLAAILPFPGEEYRPAGWETTVLVLSPAVVLPWRRRWPLPALAVCLLLYGVTVWSGVLSPGVTLGVAIAMFGVANRASRRRTLLIGAIAVTVVFLFSVPAVLENILDARIFQFVLAVAFAAAAGDGARSRRAYVEAITERAERAERTREAEASRRVTEERLRIARDLHDAVAHQIAVISLNAGVASSVLDSNTDKARTALGTIREAARTVLTEIGDLMTMLRAGDTHPEGIDTAPQHGLDNLETLLHQFRTAGLDVHLRTDGDPHTVTGHPGLVAYRVLQEALTNAHKHGAEHRAHVLLDTTPTRLRIVVANPTTTPPASPRGDAEPARSGMGLVGMRERVASVRGTLTTGPTPGGWKVEATLPLTKDRTP